MKFSDCYPQMPGYSPQRFEALIALTDAALARRALAGDELARYLAHLSHPARWFEATGEEWADAPMAVHAAAHRRARRRVVLRGR